MTMLQVIGISTTVEYMLKGSYEYTIGRFTRWTAGGTDTEEDRIIAQAHRAYSDMIFDKAWYEFDFSAWQARIWSDTDFFGENFIRKLERKLFFSMEFGFKSIYAKLIGFGAQTAYEQSEGLIYMVAKVPTEANYEFPVPAQVVGEEGDELLLSVPRWGEFSKTIPILAKHDIQFVEISGNQNIIFSLLSNTDSANILVLSSKLISSELVSNPNRYRSYSLVKVKDLSAAIKEAVGHGFDVEHIFDY